MNLKDNKKQNNNNDNDNDNDNDYDYGYGYDYDYDYDNDNAINSWQIINARWMTQGKNSRLPALSYWSCRPRCNAIVP